MPTEYLKRLYFDSLVYTHPQLEYLVRQYGADHVLMGTDYPADMGEIDPVGFIEGAAGLSADERAAILGSERRATAGNRGTVRRDRDCFVAALLAMTCGGVSC